MALIHTITVNTGLGTTYTEKRQSENRRYTACLVVTTTEETVRLNAERKVKAEAELVKWPMKLAARVKQHGMTVEQAKAWTKDATEKWYGPASKREGYWKALDQARPEVGDQHHSERASKRAHEIMVSWGFSDPYDYDKNPCGIVQASDNVLSLTSILTGWKVPTVGQQGVYSWHANVNNAQKAIGGLNHVRAYGDSIEVRTDITVRETVKRTSKASKAVAS
jgi:hypothetical protein